MKRSAFLNREGFSARARLIPRPESATRTQAVVLRPRPRYQSLGVSAPEPRNSGVAIVWSSLGLFEKLRPQHLEIQRCIDADLDLVAIDAHHLDGDVVANSPERARSRSS